MGLTTEIPDIPFGRWARNYGATWDELAEAADLDDERAQDRYAIPPGNCGEPSRH